MITKKILAAVAVAVMLSGASAAARAEDAAATAAPVAAKADKAAAKEQKFEAHKAKIQERLKKKEACVDAAKNGKDLKGCKGHGHGGWKRGEGKGGVKPMTNNVE